ncbi:MAG: hypothetical protein EOO65_05275, partial [Methanosarcinales archaeon]
MAVHPALVGDCSPPASHTHIAYSVAHWYKDNVCVCVCVCVRVCLSRAHVRAVIPRSQFKLREWSAQPDPETACEARHRMGERANKIPGVTFGMLTHGTRSMDKTLATYDERGMFDLVDEFLVYINNRVPEID